MKLHRSIDCPAGAVAEKESTEISTNENDSDDEVPEQSPEEIASVVQKEKYAIIGMTWTCVELSKIPDTAVRQPKISSQKC